MERGDLPEEAYRIIRQIPAGRVMNYGQVGQLLSNKVSGKLVGAWLAKCPEGVPWWRVVAVNGSFPVGRKGPIQEKLQSELLAEEGVPFGLNGVDMDIARWEPE